MSYHIKYFLVPLAEDAHGKGTIIRALVNSSGTHGNLHNKGPHALTCPCGRAFDSYVFVRSFQEVEKKDPYGNPRTVEQALDANDPDWRQRSLIILPSHLVLVDTAQIIQLAKRNGFNVIVAHIILRQNELPQFGPILEQEWDTRIECVNSETDNQATRDQQCIEIGRDLFTKLCHELCV